MIPQFVNVNLSDEQNIKGQYPKVVPVRIMGSDIPLSGGGVTTGAAEPESPIDGDMFFNTTDGLLKIYTAGIWQTVATLIAPPTAPIIDSIAGSTESPATGNDSTPNIVISNVQNGDEVNVYDGETLIGTGTSSGTSITITLSELSESQHSITAATSRSGMVSDNSSTFLYTYEQPVSLSAILPDDFTKYRGADITRLGTQVTFPNSETEYNTNVNYGDDYKISFDYLSGSATLIFYLRGSANNVQFGGNSVDVQIDGGTIWIGYATGGGHSWPYSDSFSISNGDNISIEVVANTVNVYKNSVLAHTSSAHYASGSYIGVYGNNTEVLDNVVFEQI